MLPSWSINIDVVITLYNLIGHSNNYWKAHGSLWQYSTDGAALTDAGAIDISPGNSALFIFKTCNTGRDGTIMLI